MKPQEVMFINDTPRSDYQSSFFKFKEWNLLKIQAELAKQRTFLAEQEKLREKRKKNAEESQQVLIYFILSLLILPIILKIESYINYTGMITIYSLYLLILLIVIISRLKGIGPAQEVINVSKQPPCFDPNHYNEEYYNDLRKWESIRLAERAEEEREEEKIAYGVKRQEEQKQMEARRMDAEQAQKRGEDVCMDCYTIDPTRCNCGNCSCHGYCYVCDD